MRTSLVAAVATGCLALLGTPAAAGGGQPAPPVPEVDTSSSSLSEAGRALASSVDLTDAPRYSLRVDLEPARGRVRATMRANLPAEARDHLFFRFFPGLPALDAHPVVEDASVDRRDVEPELEQARLHLPSRGDGEGRVDVRLSFSYKVVPPVPSDPINILGGQGTLDPATIGLLARHADMLVLGHWFPVWLPQGSVDAAAPEGFGDIANFPAAVIRAEITAPAGWQVVTSGANTERNAGERRTVVEQGFGLRDLSIVAARDAAQQESVIDGITVRATGPPEAREHFEAVVSETAEALRLFSERFGGYPWSELDVVAVPLGSSVAGMEWPGAIWIESNLFAGGIPGLDLTGLNLPGGEDSPFGEGLEELLASLGGADVGSIRAFAIAHEVSHEWWHALVGNDSIAAPVVDEPLAQHSACLVAQARQPELGDAACTSHIDGQYQTMRSLDVPDAPADQASDVFESGLQYGGVVYGKAPGFYRALEALIGPDAVIAGLRDFATTFAWREASPDDLRAAFGRVAPDRAAEIDALWNRWMHETHGDEDLGTAAPGLPGVDLKEIEKIFEQLAEALDQFPNPPQTSPARGE
jgi:hypothetical protein